MQVKVNRKKLSVNISYVNNILLMVFCLSLNKANGRYECRNISAVFYVLYFLSFKYYNLKSKNKTAPGDTENIFGSEETLRGTEV
jgi:uncharacterized membrane protein (DUF373 family)